MVIGQNAQTILEARAGKQHFKMSYINAKLQNLLFLVFFLTLQTLGTLKVLPHRGTFSAQGNDHSLVSWPEQLEAEEYQATLMPCKGFNCKAMSFCCLFKNQI